VRTDFHESVAEFSAPLIRVDGNPRVRTQKRVVPDKYQLGSEMIEPGELHDLHIPADVGPHPAVPRVLERVPFITNETATWNWTITRRQVGRLMRRQLTAFGSSGDRVRKTCSGAVRGVRYASILFAPSGVRESSVAMSVPLPFAVLLMAIVLPRFFPV